MRTTYFDCFSGISGDMTIGALIDAGLSFEALRAQLAMLPVDGYELSVEKVKKRGFGGTKFHVRVCDANPQHRRLHDIEAMVRASGVDATVQERALAVFTRLAEAEATVHQSTVDQVHFHEVGASIPLSTLPGRSSGCLCLAFNAPWLRPSMWARASCAPPTSSNPTPITRSGSSTPHRRPPWQAAHKANGETEEEAGGDVLPTERVL